MTIATKSPKSLKLLFADDERSLQGLMSLELPQRGHEVTVCPDGLTAVAALEKNTYDCILVDLDMPGLSGIEVMARAKALSPETEAIVLTGKSSLDTAVAALGHGACGYLTKPCKWAELDHLLDKVAERREMKNRLRAVQSRLERLEGGARLVGQSAAMEQVQKMISRIAPTDSTVLIRGETGTGKELVARALHDQSLRHEAPFVAINCGALPESLIESELFGHRKGAFTGADERRIGLFEVASGGTLFLDEIGELPKGMQAKLLRFLESGEIRRVGENTNFVVDVRVVCATHRDLEKMVLEGDFREDLLFRINTFEIHLPALRERVEDIPLLATHLLKRYRPHAKPGDMLFTPAAMKALAAHTWSGNVRELANCIEHAAILCDGGPVDESHLPRRFHTALAAALAAAPPASAPASAPTTAPVVHAAHGAGISAVPAPHAARRGFGAMSLRDIEMQAIHEALDRHQGNKPKAAEELGISLKTLYNKLNQAANEAA